MTQARTHSRFAGVLKIVRFNLRFYVLSAAALIALCLLLCWATLPPPVEGAIIFGCAMIAFWTLSSLLVSWYVYDYKGVTRWEWLPSRLPALPRCWANIHAGLDESTSALRRLFPGTTGSVVDIYDPGEMTEPSIAKARAMYPSDESFKRGTYDSLPLPESSFDAVFLLFSAHEVRREEHRIHLLRQTASLLRDNGCVVLVEHLRDWSNFIAFGPGFFHFHSRRNWLDAIRQAGLIVMRENSITPFVKCFVLRRPD